MSYNAQKMAYIILDECKSIEERCDAYKETLVEVIVDILNAEKHHSLQRTRIQQQIDDICDKAGDFLYRNRSKVSEEEI